MLRLTLTLLAVLLAAGCASVNPYYDASKAHHRPTGFANNNAEISGGRLPLYEVFWRRLRGDFRPQHPPEGGYAQFIQTWTTPVDLDQLHKTGGPPRITWLGHASLLLQTDELNILIDPHLTDYAGPVRWLSAKRRVPPALRVAQLPRIDLVLISHSHYDHLDLSTIRELKKHGQQPKYIVPLGLKAWFADEGISAVQEMDWWDHLDIGATRVHFTPAQHWSKRTPFDANRSLWGGFFIEIAVDRKKTRFFYTGDTGYSDDFKRIRTRLGKADFLAVPMGAYEPRDFMRPQHNNPDEAVQILLDMEAQHALGVHWGSFELSQERFDQPPRDLLAALENRQLPAERFWLMRQGETRALPLVDLPTPP